MRTLKQRAKEILSRLLTSTLPAGTTKPSENAADRNLWVQSQLAALPAGSRILDAGAGTCRYKRFCSHLQYVSQDFNQYDGRGDGQGLQTGDWPHGGIDIVSDITNIPLPDASLDAILCTEVLEHVADPIAALSEFSRLLKESGVLILTAPFCSLTHFSPFHFCTGFNRYFYIEHLSRLGLAIKDISHNGNYFDYLEQEIRRLSSVNNRFGGTKPKFLHKVISAISILYLTHYLKYLSSHNVSSHQLLTFGYHICAEKKSS